MTNKERIKKLRDNAELAMASYGYFHLVGKSIKKDNKIVKEAITQTDILDVTYNGYKVKDTGLIFDDELKGDMTPTQAKRFFERYDLLDHCSNTESGFSATLFGEKRKQTNKETKEISYTSEYGYINYVLAIRGTEPSNMGDINADMNLTIGKIPKKQYEDMLNFYIQCKTKYPNITKPKSLNIAGHSLGGALAQMLTLSLCDDNNEANINEIYTFNSPGARDLKPPYSTIIYIPNATKESVLHSLTQTLTKEAQTLHLSTHPNDLNQKLESILDDSSHINTYFGISFYFNNDEEGTLTFTYEKIPYDLLQPYQTLTHNYNNRNKESYKLSVSDRVYHIETDDDNNTENNQWQDELIQNLGKDIDGNHYYINIGIGLKGLEYVKVGKWFDSHAIVPTAQTLYFYSYLLELDSNYNKVKDKSFSECIEYCNKFMNDIKIHLETFVIATNKNNKRSFEIKNGPFTLFRDSPKEMDFLEIFLSRVAVIIGKSNQELSMQGKSYYTSSMQPTIPKESIIDFITTLSNDGYYMSILDKEYFAEIRKKCDDINNINNVGYKACLAEYRNFIIINKNNQTIENKDNLGLIYGYDSSVYRAVHNRWCETSLGSHCKIIQGLYYGGKATMIAVKGS